MIFPFIPTTFAACALRAARLEFSVPKKSARRSRLRHRARSRGVVIGYTPACASPCVLMLFSKTEAFMKTRVAATAALALVLLSIGALISCNKAKAPQPAQQTGQAAPASPSSASKRIPTATPTSARNTSTPVGRWMPGSWATASPDLTTPSSMLRARPSSIPWATTSRSTRPWTSWV